MTKILVLAVIKALDDKTNVAQVIIPAIDRVDKQSLWNSNAQVMATFWKMWSWLMTLTPK